MEKDGMPTPKKKRKWPVVVGAVVAVIVAAGAGFAIWHEQPSFCNAVCHEPMDNYVDGYYHDASLMANEHGQSGVACLDCHEAKLDEQVSEGLAWMRGDYRVDEEGNLATVGVTADVKQCAKSGCHSVDEIVAATENWGGQTGVNPHRSHQGTAIDCSNCHSAHGESYLYCNTCHDYELPDGWNNPR